MESPVEIREEGTRNQESQGCLVNRGWNKGISVLRKEGMYR